MDALNLVPRAGPVASRRVHEHFTTASSGNQTYSHITASGHSTVQNGNNYYITYDCRTGYGPQPMLPSDQQAMFEQFSRSPQKRKRSVSDVPGTAKGTRGDRERQTLTTVLESLGQYSKSMQQRTEGEKSEQIATQLALILESFEQAVSAGDKTDDLDRQVQDLQKQLHGAKHIKINAVLPLAHALKQHKAQRKLTRITCGHWEISLSTKTVHSQLVNGQMLTQTCSALHVRHAAASQGPSIAAFFSESVDFDRTETMHPIVLAYNQVNSGAEVFTLVEEDDLDGLMRHLALGKASIRDCDERGRSLLHHACHHASDAICKFLVESGCDVDRIEADFLPDNRRSTPLANFKFLDQEADEYSLERSLMCRKYLLQAGADPNIGEMDTGDADGTWSVIEGALGSTHSPRYFTEPFELILREGSAYFDVRSLKIQGQSLWMHSCINAWRLISPKILQILAQAGALIEETDDDGWNGLFQCVMNSDTPYGSGEFGALQCLLTIFDDVFARDSSGLDLFELVCEPDDRSDLGSYLQDLWYCAVYRSALSTHFDIPPPPSQPVFGSGYTIRHYRALLYLDTWDTKRSYYPLLDKGFLSDEEKETFPGFHEWDPSDLLMMEERLDKAIHLMDDSDDGYDDDDDDENDDDDGYDDDEDDEESYCNEGEEEEKEIKEKRHCQRQSPPPSLECENISEDQGGSEMHTGLT